MQWHPSEEEDDLVLDDRAKAACFLCFRTGLIFNTCVTIGVAAAVPACHSADTEVSAVAVLLAALLGVLIWTWRACFESMPHDYQPPSGVCSEDGEAGEPLSPLPATARLDNLHHASNLKSCMKALDTHHRSCKSHTLGASCAVLSSVVGAVAPLAPWALHIWQDQGGSNTALAASAALAVAAAACGVFMVVPHAESASPTLFCQQALGTAVVAAAACGVGFVWGRLGLGAPEIFLKAC